MTSHHSKPPAMASRPSTMALEHPRRVAAHKSVSLLHSKRDAPPDRESKRPAKDKTRESTNSPSSLAQGRESSGESSNAERWFEKSNNEVQDQTDSFADDEPPFFMHNSSGSSGTPPVAGHGRKLLSALINGSESLPTRTNMLQLGTDGSSTEEYRGVIDDLTIENKKLKRRLKRYEKLQDSHLRDQKLFELRIHGLPPAKKRELEETLRQFADSLATGFPVEGYETLVPALKATSSQTSYQNTDSAYASMSASGPGSSALSGTDRAQKQAAQTPSARRQNIHSYLHHIPEGLLPQHNPTAMSERAKKKLVISRLEQVFTGNRAVGGRHHHLLQQQEVSRLAARHDLKVAAATGGLARREGNREATILPRTDAAVAVVSSDQPHGTSSSPDEPKTNEQHEAETLPRNPSPSGDHQSRAERTEQRPTRPLDLDPHRAQVAAENISYIRHLGFSPLDPHSTTPPEDDHGWIYLNLLTNMAQLHTVNVTTEFVKKALTECSSRFELSSDGRKVRWVGGRSVGYGEGSVSSGGFDTPEGESPRKRTKLRTQNSTRSNGTSASRAQNDPKFVYTPMFYHRDNSEETDDSSSEEDDNSTSSRQLAQLNGDSSAMTSSGMHTASTRKRKVRDDGPMIFYKSAGFITDLSGELSVDGSTHAPHYMPASVLPVGHPTPINAGSSERKGPLASANELPEPMDLGDNPIPPSLELTFPLSSTPRSDSSTADAAAMEVTGIGGVWPADNFAINVKSRHCQIDGEGSAIAGKQTSSIPISAKLVEILHSSKVGSSKPRIVRQHQVLSSERKDLAPSQLPPALNWMPADEESDDEDSGAYDEDEMAWEPQLSDGHAPSAAPQPVELHYDFPLENDEDNDESTDEDDGSGSESGSVDMLAAVREVNPEVVRAQELEYDAISAERLAEEIPAGSSAATAGGGSGFASPVGSSVDPEEHKRASRRARRRAAAAMVAGFKKARDSDSIIAQDSRRLDDGSSDEDEAHEDDDVRS